MRFVHGKLVDDSTFQQDAIFHAPPPAIVNGTAGNDFIHVAGDGLTPPAGYNDLPGATTGDDTIDAGKGDDIIYAGGGSDTIDAGNGNDQIFIGYVPDTHSHVDGGAGVDVVSFDLTRVDNEFDNTLGLTLDLSNPAAALQFLVANPDSAHTGEVDVTGVESFDVTFGSGNDTITGGKYADVLYGDGYNFPGGDDVLHGGGGNDTLNGEAGSDQLYGDDGNDFIAGGQSRSGSSLFEDFAPDQMHGGDGNDILAGGQGDLFDGGAGHDIALIHLEDSTFSYTVALKQALTASLYDWGDGTQTEGIEHIDQLYLGSGNDHVTANVTQFGGPAMDNYNGGIFAGDGNDVITITGTLTTGQQIIDGGAGIDTVRLTGDYGAAPFVLDNNSIIRVEKLILGAGHDYDLDLGNGGSDFTQINAGALGAADKLTLDLDFWGVAAHLSVLGGAGDDTVLTGWSLRASQHLDFGAGSDTLAFDANLTITMGADTLTSLETMRFDDTGSTYVVRTADGNVAAGQTLTVDASALGGGDKLTFIGSAETDGHFHFIGGSGADTFTGGHLSDIIQGGMGADVLNGFGGGDTFVYGAAADSDAEGYDRITGFDAGADKISLWYAVTGIDPELSGAFSKLSQLANAQHLAADHALLFSATDGHSYLVVDANGIAGYQADQDMVIRLDAPVNLAALSTANFVIG
jgi:Ca2+-binding RTX toxin-like protein